MKNKVSFFRLNILSRTSQKYLSNFLIQTDNSYQFHRCCIPPTPSLRKCVQNQSFSLESNVNYRRDPPPTDCTSPDYKLLSFLLDPEFIESE